MLRRGFFSLRAVRVGMSDRVHIDTQETGLAIDATGEIFQSSVEIAKLISVNIQATANADYALDVSPDGDTWFDAEVEYVAADEPDPQDIRDVFELTDRYVRLRVTAAATADATADVVVQGVR